MHLSVVMDGHHTDDRLGLAVAGDQHCPGADPAWIAGLAQGGPAESLVVFVVEVRCQVDARSIRSPPLPRLRVVVDVRHDLMRAADKPLHAVLQVIEAHGVVTRIAAVGSSRIPAARTSLTFSRLSRSTP